jgi:protein tyrosine/serine phosphatase
MHRGHVFAILFLVFSTALACAAEAPSKAEPAARPAHWAQPLQKPGLENLHQVTPTLFRGAQPTAEGMKTLEGMGIKTVINLRQHHSDADELEGVQLKSIHIKVNTFHPDYPELVGFMKAVTDPANQPVFVHCMHGADRTGMMIALYRIAVQGWTKGEALRELREGGFGFHTIWKNIPKIVEQVDIEKLRKDAGLAPPPKAVPAP